MICIDGSKALLHIESQQRYEPRSCQTLVLGNIALSLYVVKGPEPLPVVKFPGRSLARTALEYSQLWVMKAVWTLQLSSILIWEYPKMPAKVQNIIAFPNESIHSSIQEIR